MHTGAISYRVADFLKQHPPFSLIEEQDLLTLASKGRVKFYEVDEFICWQSSSYSPFIVVIQQGSVSLWEGSEGEEKLLDIRGPGDLLGIERYLGSAKYPYSAKANGDLVVYALNAADFAPLLEKYPPATRYIEAYAAAGAVYQDAGREDIHQMFVAELAHNPEPLSCAPDASVAEAAGILQRANAQAIAVMDGREILGLVTTEAILGLVAAGESVDRPVRELMSAPPPSVAPDTRVNEALLAMAGSAAGVAALTADGTQHGGLLRLVTASDLQPAFGDNPVALLRDVARAADTEVLRLLHLRARAFFLNQLNKPATIDWLAELADRFNTALIRRLLALAGTEEQDCCWCFWGAAGRHEALTAVTPSIAVICPDAVAAGRATTALAQIYAGLPECGYLTHSEPQPETITTCATVADWQNQFRLWIEKPLFNDMYDHRALFDLRPAFGAAGLYTELKSCVGQMLAGKPGFRTLLANDCLAELPPLTFFEDSVVDADGEKADVLDLENRAIRPIVDAGRVFGIASGGVLGASTLARLELARLRAPEHDQVFRESADTLRVLLYLQARAGLRLRSGGSEIPTTQISRLDRQALKSGFRAIHTLLDFTFRKLCTEAG